MALIDQFIPADVERPFVSPHPDGGAVIFWTEQIYDPATRSYAVEVKAAQLSAEGSVSAPVTLIEEANAALNGYALFSAPVIAEDGGFTLLIATSPSAHDTLSFSFESDFTLLGPPTPVNAPGLSFGSATRTDDYATLPNGETAIIDPDGNLAVLSAMGEVLATLTGLGSLLRGSVVATGESTLTVLSRDSSGLTHLRGFEFADGELVPVSDTAVSLPPSYRDPVGVQLGDALIVVSNFRDLSNPAARIDTVFLHAVDAAGIVTLVDEIPFAPEQFSMSNAIVATPDGGFAMAIHEGPYGAGGTFRVRQYDADGTFREERVVGEGLGSSNNGGYDHQITALATGALLFSWQTPDTDGTREGGHLFDLLTPHLHGTDGGDMLTSRGVATHVFGHDGADLILGAQGADTLWGGAGADTLSGGAEDDDLSGEEGDDLLRGNNGADSLFGGAGNDDLRGGRDADDLFGKAGDDTLNGQDGQDYMVGGAGDDVLRGGGGADAIYAGTGNDLLLGGNASDRLHAQGGDDTVYGNNGADTLKGSLGNDQLYGGRQDDVLIGAEGADQLWGGKGADRLIGGVGNDLLHGGSGADRFVFEPPWGADTIMDFDPAQDALVFKYPGLDFDALTITALPGGHASIRLGISSIELVGVDAASLGADDFIF